MKLLQFTDIHITTPGETIGGRDPMSNFDKALENAMEHHGDAEGLFITGDLSDWGDKADYEWLKGRMATAPMPVHLCIGNHDDRAVFLSVFSDLEDEGFVQKVVPLSRGHAILLDTWGPESHAGFFCEKRAAWLDDRLGALDGPIWLFLHHNPVGTTLPMCDQIMLLDHARFAETIYPYRTRISHIFHGHCHLPLSGSLHGIPISAPRGTNHAGWADFGNQDSLAASDLPEAYAVIIANDISTIVHMVEFGYQGEIRREGSPDYAEWDRATMAR